MKPAVANISIKSASALVSLAVDALIDSQVFVAVSAGNDNVDACTQSPAHVPAAFTVAASTKTDAKASWSNWGKCVDIYAPGQSIKSAQLNGTATWMSGTSMAAPHVTGTAVLWCDFLGRNYCIPSQLTQLIKDYGSMNQITGNPAGTPNLLVFKRFL